MATFVRVYETEGQAAAAVRDLQSAGFGASGLLYVTPDTADAAGAATAAGMSEYAGFAAEQVALERSVVGVKPPFGQGAVALKSLDAAGPMAVEMPKTEVAAATSGESDATPLSNKFGWPVLSHDPAPLSSWLGWKVKSDNAAPLSDRLGLGTVSSKVHYMVSELRDDPTPLSSWLGWQVLSDSATPLSDKFGWQVKSDKRHYMVDELTDDPTPLSSRVGMKVLSDQQ